MNNRIREDDNEIFTGYFFYSASTYLLKTKMRVNLCQENEGKSKFCYRGGRQQKFGRISTNERPGSVTLCVTGSDQ